MPIKSKAQRRKFAQLLMEGKISDQVYEEWNRGAGSKELPERLHPPKDGSRTVKKTRTATKAKATRSAKKTRTAKPAAARKRPRR